MDKVTKLFDCHSHWGTKRGYLFRTEAELAQQEKIWKTKATFWSEDEMADYFRQNNVRTILDLSFTKFLPIEEIRAHHDYAFDFQRKHPDAVFGHCCSSIPAARSKNHREHKVLFCLVGSIVFHTDEGDLELSAGDRIDVPAFTAHAATVGPDGCSCIEAYR